MAAGYSWAWVPVAHVNDATAEPEESYSLSAWISGGPYASGSAVITDDDGWGSSSGSGSTSGSTSGSAVCSVDSLSVYASNVGESQAGGFYVQRFGSDYNCAVNVEYSLSNGTAVSGDDYTSASGTANIAAGYSWAWVPVSITNDTTAEPDEDFNINVWIPNGPSASGSATIYDDDGWGSSSGSGSGSGSTSGSTSGSMCYVNGLGISAMSAAESANNTNGNESGFYLSRNGDLSCGVNVQYGVYNGSATAYTDFLAPYSGSYDFAPGESQVWIPVTYIDDSEPEPTETYQAQAWISNNGANISVSSEGWIIDNDGSGSGSSSGTTWLQVAASDTAEDYGNGFYVYRGSDTSQDEYVNWQLWDITTEGAADFGVTSGQVYFPAGVTSAWVDLHPYADNVPEEDETYSLSAWLSTNANINTNDVGTLYNDDYGCGSMSGSGSCSGSGSGSAWISAAGGSRFEDERGHGVSLTRGGDISQGAVVEWAVSDLMTMGLTDFNFVGGTVSFAPGSSSAWIPLDPIPDGNVEPDETYRVSVWLQAAPTVFALAEGTLKNDDAPYSPTDIRLTEDSVEENKLAGTPVGTLVAVDWNGMDTHSFALVPGEGSADNASFTIAGSELKTAAVFNFEVKREYKIRVRATDQTNRSFERPFLISVSDINEGRPTIADGTFSIDEGAPNGAFVGRLDASDPDTGAPLTYLITGGNTGSAFSIDHNTGRITVNDRTRLARDTTYSLTVEVSDEDAQTDTGTATINVTPPTATGPDAVDDAYTVERGQSVRLTREKIEQENGLYEWVDKSLTRNDSNADRFRTELVGAAPAPSIVDNFNLSDDGSVTFKVRDCPCVNGVAVNSFSFQYRLTNGVLSDTATVTVSITDNELSPSNDTIYLDDTVETYGPANNRKQRLVHHNPLDIPRAHLYANDSLNYNGNPFAIEIYQNPAFGTLTTTTDGFRYQPRVGWMDLAARNGDTFDTFKYRLKDVNSGEFSEDIATVKIFPPKNNICTEADPVTDDDAPGQTPINSDGGYALIGGGDDDFIMNWLQDSANGGDIVIIKASASSIGYTQSLCYQNWSRPPQTLPMPKSVKSFIVDTAEQANSTEIRDAILKSEAIMIGGGDQSLYMRLWPGTLVGNALAAVIPTTAVAGTSAGMAILGQTVYTGVNGSADSYTAIRDPHNSTMEEFKTSFLTGVAWLPDTHFYQRDRMGRALAFAAREGKTVIASDEGTAYITKNDSVQGAGSVYFITPRAGTSHSPSLMGTFDIKRRIAGSTMPEQYTLTVDANHRITSSVQDNGVNYVYGSGRPNPSRSPN